MKVIRDNPKKQIKGYSRVCFKCDGKACAGKVQEMDSIGTANLTRIIPTILTAQEVPC